MLQLGGFRFPGFTTGHFLLRNHSRAFCLLTSRQHVVHLLLRDGKSQRLLSPEHPRALLDALRAASNARDAAVATDASMARPRPH